MRKALIVRNKYPKIRNCLISIALLFFAFFLCTFIGTKTASSDAYTWNEISYEKKYSVGETLSIAPLTFEYKGQKYDAQSILHCPDKSAKSVNQIKFTETGAYTIEYRTFVGEKLLKKEYTINVYEEMFSVSGKTSTAVYGIDDSDYQTGLSGIKLTLAAGDVFKWNKPVDLKKLGTEKNAVSLILLPETIGKRDITDVLICFTDVYDSSNTVYVKVNAIHNSDTDWTRKTAMYHSGTDTNLMYGKNYSEGAYAYELESTWYRYGYSSLFSFTANGANPVGKEFISVSFDLDNKIVLGPKESASYNGGSRVIAELGDKSLFGNAAWSGFTTGEAFMSIKCDGYSSAGTCKMLINAIGDEDLSEKEYDGAIGERIFVDTLGYEEERLPIGVAGKEYKLFEGKKLDFDEGLINIKPRVFFEYDSSTRFEENVVNMRFTPKIAGNYTICYRSESRIGGVVEKTLKLSVVQDEIPIRATINEKSDEIKAGERISLPDYTVAGGSGRIDCRVYAILGNKVELLENDFFIPQSSGEYILKYVFTDYLGQTKESDCGLKVKNNPKPLIDSNDVYLPEYLIEGATYEMPEIYAYDYSDGTQRKINTSITYTDGNGTTSSLTVIPKNNEDGIAKIRYIAVGNEDSSYIDYEIPIISTEKNGELDISAYFVEKGITKTLTADRGLVLSATNDSGRVSFINPILADAFSMKIRIPSEASEFLFFDIYLRDSQSKKILKISINKGGENAFLAINDNLVPSAIKSKFVNTIIGPIKYEKGVVSVNSDVQFKIDEYYGGESFDCFKSGKVYVEVGFSGVKGKSQASIYTIGNQVINSSITSDEAAPAVSIKGEYQFVHTINESVTVLDALVGDILDPNVNATLTVMDSDNAYVTAKDGTILNGAPLKEYEIQLTKYGSYRIIYMPVDSKGNKVNSGIIYSITVCDFTAPQINVEWGIKGSVEVGKEIIVPVATVTDNIDSDLKYEVYVRTPNFYLLAIKAGDKYKFDVAGLYKFTYFATDTDGNLTVLSFSVMVREVK